MYEVVPRPDCDRDVWDAAADMFPSAWAWHRSVLLDARATWHLTEDLSFCVCDSSSRREIVALVPLVLVKSRFLPTVVHGHFESTGGPAVKSSLTRRSKRKVQECIESTLVSLARKFGVRRIDFSLAPLAPEFRSIDRPFPNPLCFLGASDSSTQTWMVPLRQQEDVEALWSGLEHRSRKQIKKAERRGLRAEIIRPDADLLDIYYEFHEETCNRNCIAPHPKAYFRTIFEAVSGNDLCRTCIVHDEDNVLSIQNFLVYKNAALYWTVASSSDALKMCANDYGMWWAIRHFHKAGYHFLECGEAFPAVNEGKKRGLNDFKKSFGGQLYPYYRASIIQRPVLEAVLCAARHYRRGGAAT